MSSERAEGPDHVDAEPIPLDPMTMEPVTYGEPSLNAMSPMGQVESYGRFARGLGPRRVKIALVVVGLFILVPALIDAFS